MNTYQIRYQTGQRGVPIVVADCVELTDDIYIFKLKGEIVAIISKAAAISVVLVRTDGETHD